VLAAHAAQAAHIEKPEKWNRRLDEITDGILRAAPEPKPPGRVGAFLRARLDDAKGLFG
jgi:hypothetical protein